MIINDINNLPPKIICKLSNKKRCVRSKSKNGIFKMNQQNLKQKAEVDHAGQLNLSQKVKVDQLNLR